jgi:hypothetical protein
MKKYILGIFIIILTTNAFAQNIVTISGQVLDSLTAEPLIGASINVNYGQMNLTTDNK